jgi:hypothetical protein
VAGLFLRELSQDALVSALHLYPPAYPGGAENVAEYVAENPGGFRAGL